MGTGMSVFEVLVDSVLVRERVKVPDLKL